MVTPVSKSHRCKSGGVLKVHLDFAVNLLLPATDRCGDLQLVLTRL